MNRSSPAASDCPDAASAQHRDAASARHPYSVSAMASASSVASEASSDATTTPQPSARSYACRIDPDAVADDLTPLVEKASGLVAAAAPTPDAILGSFIGIAALIRSVSFQEGRLLEEAMIAIGQRNPDLVVLSSGVRLPVTPAALEAVAHNRPGALKGLSFDADARSRSSYTPDLVTVNRRYRSALVIDVKRSLASYLATHRLAELKIRMLAASLILPDWLYKEQKRLTVDSVGIAIVDGSSGVSEHEAGLWGLAEIDDLLEIEGAAAAMMRVRERFAIRVQELIEAETLRIARPLLGSETTSRTDGGTCDPRADESADGRGNDFHGAPFFEAFASGSSDRLPRMERAIRFGFAQPRLHA